MKIVTNISVPELKVMAERMFGELIKVDVDIAKKIMIIDMAMHYEGEAKLLEQGSRQNDIWGINLHPADYGSDNFVEFDSMINIRPSQDNPSKDVLDKNIRQQIIAIVNGAVHE